MEDSKLLQKIDLVLQNHSHFDIHKFRSLFNCLQTQGSDSAISRLWKCIEILSRNRKTAETEILLFYSLILNKPAHELTLLSSLTLELPKKYAKLHYLIRVLTLRSLSFSNNTVLIPSKLLLEIAGKSDFGRIAVIDYILSREIPLELTSDSNTDVGGDTSSYLTLLKHVYDEIDNKEGFHKKPQRWNAVQRILSSFKHVEPFEMNKFATSSQVKENMHLLSTQPYHAVESWIQHLRSTLTSKQLVSISNSLCNLATRVQERRVQVLLITAALDFEQPTNEREVYIFEKVYRLLLVPLDINSSSLNEIKLFEQSLVRGFNLLFNQYSCHHHDKTQMSTYGYVQEILTTDRMKKIMNLLNSYFDFTLIVSSIEQCTYSKLVAQLVLCGLHECNSVMNPKFNCDADILFCLATSEPVCDELGLALMYSYTVLTNKEAPTNTATGTNPNHRLLKKQTSDICKGFGSLIKYQLSTSAIEKYQILSSIKHLSFVLPFINKLILENGFLTLYTPTKPVIKCEKVLVEDVRQVKIIPADKSNLVLWLKRTISCFKVLVKFGCYAEAMKFLKLGTENSQKLIGKGNVFEYCYKKLYQIVITDCGIDPSYLNCFQNWYADEIKKESQHMLELMGVKTCQDQIDLICKNADDRNFDLVLSSLQNLESMLDNHLVTFNDEYRLALTLYLLKSKHGFESTCSFPDLFTLNNRYFNVNRLLYRDAKPGCSSELSRSSSSPPTSIPTGTPTGTPTDTPGNSIIINLNIYNDELIISRSEPFNPDNQQLVFQTSWPNFETSVNDIHALIDKSNKDLCKNKQEFWAKQRQYDSDLQMILENIENNVLRFFRGALSNSIFRMPNQQFIHTLNKVFGTDILQTKASIYLYFFAFCQTYNEFEQLLLTITQTLDLDNESKQKINEQKTNEQKTNEQKHEDLKELINLFKETSNQKDLSECSDYVEYPVILVCDRWSSRIPWESFPCLRNTVVTRAASQAQIKEWNELMNSQTCSVGLSSGIYGTNGTQKKKRSAASQLNDHCMKLDPGYILNPENNLQTTEMYFKEYFSTKQWYGIIGERPTEPQILDLLKHRRALIYIGHGSGQKFISRSSIRKLSDVKNEVFLFGCRSLGVQRPLLETDALSDYTTAGSKLIMGFLWNVKDKDSDRLGMSLLTRIYDEGMPIGKALLVSKEACKLRYLTGAAAVVYSLPQLVLS